MSVRDRVARDAYGAKERGEGENAEVEAVAQEVVGEIQVRERRRQARDGPQSVVLVGIKGGNDRAVSV